MGKNNKWEGAVFPMTHIVTIEKFPTRDDVFEYLEYMLPAKEDHNFHYGVHRETRNLEERQQAWREEKMLKPFPSNRLEYGATVFFSWRKYLFGYAEVEKVIPNNETYLDFPPNVEWNDEIYPYVVKFQPGSLYVAKNEISQEKWRPAINRQLAINRSSYMKLTDRDIMILKELFQGNLQEQYH